MIHTQTKNNPPTETNLLLLFLIYDVQYVSFFVFICFLDVPTFPKPASSTSIPLACFLHYPSCILKLLRFFLRDWLSGNHVIGALKPTWNVYRCISSNGHLVLASEILFTSDVCCEGGLRSSKMAVFSFGNVTRHFVKSFRLIGSLNAGVV